MFGEQGPDVGVQAWPAASSACIMVILCCIVGIDAEPALNKSRILVAVSSPWASERLVAPIADLAQRLEAETVIAHVAQFQEDDETESDARLRGEQTLKVLADALQQQGLPAEGVMLFSNDVAKAILNTAKARSCTLIVMGVSQKGLWRRVLAGNIMRNVVRHVDLPVLLCPGAWTSTV
jgi:nucleotide-binding universal stress UspA family protein